MTIFKSRIVKREDGGTECHCAICDVTLTWFTYHDIQADGYIVGRICIPCYQAYILYQPITTS